MPKYTNLSESEQEWITKQQEKYGDEKARHAYEKYTLSIDNSNTQFVRYLHMQSKLQDRNLFRIEAGKKKGDDSKISEAEAANFNESLPNFFGDEYEA